MNIGYIPYIRESNEDFFNQISPSKSGCALDSMTHLIPLKTGIRRSPVTFNFIVSCAIMCRERSRFSAQFVPGISQPRVKTSPPTGFVCIP